MFLRARTLGALFLLAVAMPARAEVETTVPPPGLREHTPSVHALANARIVLGPGRVVPRGTLVIRDGVIEAVGAGVRPPADATVWDMTGMTLYAGFIDAYAEVRAAAPGGVPHDGDASRSPGPGSEAPHKGAVYWNRWVNPQYRVDREFTPDPERWKKLRAEGITTLVLAPPRGVIRGTSAVLDVGDGEPGRLLVEPRAALHVTLSPVVPCEDYDEYPCSPMGAYALVRQTFLDADWYARAQAAWARDPALPRPESNDALAALSAYAGAKGRVVIDAQNELYALRADRIARELRLDAILRGSGREYRRLDAIRAAGRAIILPLDFPPPPAVDTPEDAANVSLQELMHWDIAPENPGRLARAGVRIAFTAEGLPDSVAFLDAVRKAVARGLDRDAALAALTVTPAALFGLSDRLGTLDGGRIANVVVADGDLFGGRTAVREVWVDGTRYEVKPKPVVDPRGTWDLSIGGAGTLPSGDRARFQGVSMWIQGDLEHLTSTFDWWRKFRGPSIQVDGARLSFAVPADSLGGAKGEARGALLMMSATVTDSGMVGEGVRPDGMHFPWSARRIAPYVPPPDTSRAAPAAMASFGVDYPLGEFGRTVVPPPRPRTVLFKDATVWTSGPAGIIEHGSVLVEEGRIASVGARVSAPANALVVDCRGRHLTPGLIDCHAHIATDGGVSETGQTITAETRVGDFIDCDDVNIYRQLAAGVTTVQTLHGSDNTIGGQNQVIKLRWGSGPEELKLTDAMPTLKIALGENPKLAFTGDRYTSRYPQTRMGVEQLLRDEFRAAREYEAAWRAWERGKRGLPPHRDLELEAVLEVLNGRRWIHAHGYRQDELLMFMRVCDDFGIRHVTFVHVLEGYKVADEMARRGFGATTFSDWWDYKFEARDAIPYGGALMHDEGVLVSYDSDSEEMARRLGEEAGKARKYGGLSDAEALKLVTLNPAAQLGVGGRVGSIQPGKDADLALWSGPPLSPASRCEQTWIEGRKYFDRDDDRAAREEAQRMRAILIQKALRAAGAPGTAGAPSAAEPARKEVPR